MCMDISTMACLTIHIAIQVLSKFKAWCIYRVMVGAPNALTCRGACIIHIIISL